MRRVCPYFLDIFTVSDFHSEVPFSEFICSLKTFDVVFNSLLQKASKNYSIRVNIFINGSGPEDNPPNPLIKEPLPLIRE